MLVAGRSYNYNRSYNFNTKDTYVVVLGKYQENSFNVIKDAVKAQGFKMNILIDERAINYHVAHRKEYGVSNGTEQRQRLIIFELE